MGARGKYGTKWHENKILRQPWHIFPLHWYTDEFFYLYRRRQGETWVSTRLGSVQRNSKMGPSQDFRALATCSFPDSLTRKRRLRGVITSGGGFGREATSDRSSSSKVTRRRHFQEDDDLLVTFGCHFHQNITLCASDRVANHRIFHFGSKKGEKIHGGVLLRIVTCPFLWRVSSLLSRRNSHHFKIHKTVQTNSYHCRQPTNFPPYQQVA